jgi:hypothetical protein
MSVPQAFPNLNATNHEVTSPPTSEYNCIAWAAEDDERWWWPIPESVTYWPKGVPRATTQEAFIGAFATLGYAPCDSGELEHGFDKVVLYADTNNVPTHMARQLQDGAWTSKLGKSNDISHSTPDVVDGPLYGRAQVFLKRLRA